MGAIQSRSPTLGETLASLPRSPKCITIERLVDGNCDFIIPPRNQIMVGICGGKDEKNPMNNQCMRVGDNDPVSLLAFTELPNTLSYTFENNTTLQLTKRDTGEVYYYLKTPDYTVTRSIPEAVRRFYKPIGGPMAAELDKMKQLF